MNGSGLLIVAAISLPVAALGGGAWIAFRRLDRQLPFGFEGIHFET